MAQGPGTRPSSNTSFLKYMVGQYGKQGQGLDSLDRAAGYDPNMATQQTPAAPPPDAAQQPPMNTPEPQQPLTLDGPEVQRIQPSPLVLTDSDAFYRDMGRLPTAADLAANAFSQQFRRSAGRAPTKAEVVANLYRRPEYLTQVSQDYTEG